MSATTPSEAGQIVERCDPSRCLEESIFTVPSTSTGFSPTKAKVKKKRKREPPEPQSDTPESVAPPRKKTSRGRSNSSAKSVQTCKRSSKTLARASTSNAKVCFPFWSESSREISEKLWCYTETECAELPSSSWSGSLSRLARNSWFSVKTLRTNKTEPKSSPKIFLESSTTLWPRITDCVRRSTAKSGENKKPKTETKRLLSEEEKQQRYELKMKEYQLKREKGEKARKPPKPPAVKTTVSPKIPAKRSRHACLALTKEQKQVLLRWFGTARWTYNRCVSYCQIPNNNSAVTLNNLRSCFVNSDSEAVAQNPWLLKTPYEVRDAAVREFLVAYTNGMNRKKEDSTFKFALKPRKRKSDNESIAVLKKCYKNGTPYKTFWVSEESSKPLPALSATWDLLPERIPHDSKLLRKGKRFFLAVSLPLPTQRTGIPTMGSPKTPQSWLDTQEPKKEFLREPPCEKIVAIDPGVRTFASLYDPDGDFIEWGSKDINRIQRLCYYMDDLQSRIVNDSDVRARSRHRMRIALQRMRNKIRALISESHRKLAKYLCESYNVVLLPKFEVSRMIKRGARRFNSKVARQMLTWSHYRFRQCLESKAEEYPWVNIIPVTEEYTSKTCGCCGKIFSKLGGSKVFLCPACGFTVPRDFNGARNIFIKWLSN